MYQSEVVQRKRLLKVENNLLKSDNITSKLVDDTFYISINSSNEENYSILTLKDIASENIEITCNEYVKIKILINEFENKNIKFILKNNAFLKLNFLSLTQNACGKYLFDLEESSNAFVAMADLVKGNVDFNATFNLLGDNANSKWHLASLGADNDKKVFNINFNHVAKNTTGVMSNYGVVEDESMMHFKGVSHIKNGSIKSKTHQSAKIMVFDPKCHAKANPILKIDENDIEASHAAIVGKVNDEHMFYLCSRGISENDAKQLITLGYLKPITNYFEDEKYVQEIVDGIEKRL